MEGCTAKNTINNNANANTSRKRTTHIIVVRIIIIVVVIATRYPRWYRRDIEILGIDIEGSLFEVYDTRRITIRIERHTRWIFGNGCLHRSPKVVVVTVEVVAVVSLLLRDD